MADQTTKELIEVAKFKREAAENAIHELKDIATEIIPGNEEDGVARWLEIKYNIHITH